MPSVPTHRLLVSYEAWGEKKMYGRISQGVARSTVLVDPAGKVAHHWRKVKSTGGGEKVHQRLQGLLETL